MLVLAIAIFVLQHFSGSMGLVAADPKRDADVTKTRGDIVVEGAHLFLVGLRVLRQLGSFGANLRGRRDALLLQPAPPAAHLLPTLKRADLDRGRRDFAGRLLILFAFPVCALPGVDTVASLFPDRRLEVRTLHLHLAVFRHADFNLLGERDAGLVKVVCEPELARDERRVQAVSELVLEYVARPKPFHRHMLFAIIAVQGRNARHV